MTIESSSYKLSTSDFGTSDFIESARELVTEARGKELHEREQDANRAIPSNTPDLSVVVPTRNERDNVRPLLEALQNALDGLCVEVIFVDDSDDDTPQVIMGEKGTMDSSLFRIHLEHRVAGETRAGGLATAVVHGMNMAQAQYLAVIDADLQHPPEQLRLLYDHAVAQDADLVLASRYIEGGSSGGLDGGGRRFVSVGMKWVAKLLFPEQLLRISDPLGGFFLLRRSLLANVSLRPVGYKILLEILIRCQWRQVLEVPYRFQTRAHGQSKANARQGWLALRHMQRLWREIPAAGRIWKISLLLLLNVLAALALIFVHEALLEVQTNLDVIAFVVIACLDWVLFNSFILPSPVVREKDEPLPFAPTTPAEEETVVLPEDLHTIITTIEDRERAEPPPSAVTTPTEDETVVLPVLRAAISNGHQLYTVEDGERAEPLPSVVMAIADAETIELPDLRTAISNGHQLYTVEDRERAEPLPSAVMAIADAETIELPDLRAAISNGHQLYTAEDGERAELPPGKRVEPSVFNLARRFQWKGKILGRLPSAVAVAVVALAIGWIIFAQPGAWLVLVILFIGLAITFTENIDRDQAITMVLAIAVGATSIDYMSWRITATNWQGWWVSVPLLWAEFMGAVHVLGFQFTIWPQPPEEIGPGDDPTRRPIFIFIPTVNEGVEILRPTLEGVIVARDKYLARYPHGQVTIVVCNDGGVAKAANWQEPDILARELGVCCITRTKGGGAKAGNIENARRELQARGDALLVIFDADQIAKPDFLIKTIPPFRDPKMGWVQTGQYYANLDNPVSNWADDQQSMFYNLLCPGKATYNAAFICGTNVVIRASALDEIGGLPQDSVTEDFAASIALHTSWRSIYLTNVLATGLGPLDVPSYLKQQRRWALGTLGVFRTHWRDIFLPKKGGLRLGQRVQYFMACTHYLCGLRDLIYVISPILFIITGIPAVHSDYLSVYLWHFLPYCLLGSIALWYSARGLTGFRGIIIGFGSFPVLIGSLLSVILGRKVGFAVTSKKHNGKASYGYLGIYVFFLLLCVTALFWTTRIRGQEQTSLFISVMWVSYSMLMLASFLWLSFKDIRFRQALERSGATNESIATQRYASKLLNRNRGLKPVWNLLLAALLASPILASNALSSLAIFSGGEPAPFVISQEKIAAPYFGLTLPVQLLHNRPLVLEQELGVQFSIIGRTQDVHDQFDRAWADQLAAQHARPWITLQFGVFGAKQKPPLDANLPAIYNGLHDQELTRWAQAIREYGKPVYLTILQHVDRNWSLSSSVTNGGIPADAPKAWMHVQSVFRAAGATNVAWVWAPADPLHDQLYAPPASTIDAVLQSFINYPGTQWGDPETVLHNLTQRYPGKPLFVEASVSGSGAPKAEWLTKLGQAVNDIPSVYALFYHEGGPGLNPGSAQIDYWSFTSDPDSLAAMRRIAIGLDRKRRGQSTITASSMISLLQIKV